MIKTNHLFLTHSSLLALLVLLGLASSLLYRKQFLMTLLSLEFVTLGLFMGLILNMNLLHLSLSASFFILTLGACEACLGLALLINMTRFTGSDMLHLMSTMKC